jgi:gluconolactonase
MRVVQRFGLRCAIAVVCMSCYGSWLSAADRGAAMLPTVGSVERLDPRLDALVPPDARIEVLAMGFAWSEGPVWVADDRGGLPAGTLLFSDIPHNRVHRWKAGEEVSIFLEPAGFTGPAAYGRERGSNGLALDRQGRLVLCEHGDRRVSVLERDGGKRTLADAWEGKRSPVWPRPAAAIPTVSKWTWPAISSPPGPAACL